MALEVEYMMEYQYPDLLVTEDCWLQRKSADFTVMDRKKAVVSYKQGSKLAPVRQSVTDRKACGLISIQTQPVP